MNNEFKKQMFKVTYAVGLNRSNISNAVVIEFNFGEKS